ncbi:MAG: hypothetical protein WKF94_02190 [Solirubrobacteraceae bacterium]
MGGCGGGDNEPRTVTVIKEQTTVVLDVGKSRQVAEQNSLARSSARNLVVEAEVCFTTRQTYVGCDVPERLGPSGLPIGAGLGQVQLSEVTKNGYTVIAHSLSGDTFSIVNDGDGSLRYPCIETSGSGDCIAGSWKPS